MFSVNVLKCLRIDEVLKIRDVLIYTTITLAVLLLTPEEEFKRMNVNWLLGPVVVLPFTIIAGFISSSLYYRHHDVVCIDPFYVRAWSALICGSVGLPVCFLFRPFGAPFALTVFTFGVGPIIAFHAYRKIVLVRKNKGDRNEWH